MQSYAQALRMNLTKEPIAISQANPKKNMNKQTKAIENKDLTRVIKDLQYQIK